MHSDFHGRGIGKFAIDWCADLLAAMERDLGRKLVELRVDGGAAANNLLMQIQADLLQATVVRPEVIETTALGAAVLAGIGIGWFQSLEDARASWREDRRFAPGDPAAVAGLKTAWSTAVGKA